MWRRMVGNSSLDSRAAHARVEQGGKMNGHPPWPAHRCAGGDDGRRAAMIAHRQLQPAHVCAHRGRTCGQLLLHARMQEVRGMDRRVCMSEHRMPPPCHAMGKLPRAANSFH